MYYVTDKSGTQFVMRIYNNGFNFPRVAYEHAVITALSKKKFSFETPTLLPALATGESYHRLKSGAEACLFTKIPGAAPKMTCARDIGRACAEVRARVRGGHACPRRLHIPRCRSALGRADRTT